MSKRDQFTLCAVAIGFGMGLIIIFDIALRWYEWSMLALGGAFN
jgi:hypothetical protein